MNLLLLASIVTSLVAGRPVPVTCQYVGGHQGYYDDRRDVITLDPIVCAGFTAAAVSLARARAVYALVHESEHARGIVDEHQADCAALHDFPMVIRRSGLTPKLIPFAQRIHDSLPAPYSGGCT